jgi:serine protease AprX
MAQRELNAGSTRRANRRRRRMAVWLGASALMLPSLATAADTPMAAVTDTIGARDYWAAGYTGKGVDIAVIDTGVADVDGLSSPDKLIHAPDLSFDSQSATLYQRDGYGHGTHLAGIAAGRDGGLGTPSSYLTAPGFFGVAPDARVLSVKAGDAAGGVDITQVIAAVDWVVEHRTDPGMNIRVLLLAYGTNTTQPYDSEPLTDALEQAWKAGITVVVAGGNSGGTAANAGTIGLLNPARARS